MISLERAKEAFSYDPDSGLITWKISPNSRAKAGTLSSQKRNSHGYTRVCLDGVEMAAHQVAWLLTHGPVPKGMHIDHINGVRHDNRIVNLRCVTPSVNLQNRRKAATHNQLGVLGVRKHSGGKGYSAQIVHGKSIHLGTFDTPEEAHAAYIAAKLRLHTGYEASLLIQQQQEQRAA